MEFASLTKADIMKETKWPSLESYKLSEDDLKLIKGAREQLVQALLSAVQNKNTYDVKAKELAQIDTMVAETFYTLPLMKAGMRSKQTIDVKVFIQTEKYAIAGAIMNAMVQEEEKIPGR